VKRFVARRLALAILLLFKRGGNGPFPHEPPSFDQTRLRAPWLRRAKPGCAEEEKPIPTETKMRLVAEEPILG